MRARGKAAAAKGLPLSPTHTHRNTSRPREIHPNSIIHIYPTPTRLPRNTPMAICEHTLKWTVFMDAAGKTIQLPLYQVTEDIFLDPDFADKLRYLLLENPHYHPGSNITRILSPEKKEIKGKALFLILCYLTEYTERKSGTQNHYLFGERKNHGFRLIAAADDKLTVDRFRFWLKIITLKPSLVKNLVLTHMAQ